MSGLPSHIRQYLHDAAFTQTELVILNKLMENAELTLREIAARTGKSAGVLDSACKRLIRKGIVKKENINDTKKYALSSLESITKWVQKDMEQKKKDLQSRHRDFESFIASLQQSGDRPKMEYFEGDDGIQKAYLQLLEECGGQLLQFLPVMTKEEEAELRPFFVDYFRRRRRRKIFLRVIAHDTHLGKRFQSRDAFEYRKTILVPEDDFPIPFEKIIAGNTVACFDHQQKKVCFIRYPELAEGERGVFEVWWGKNMNRENKNNLDTNDQTPNSEVSVFSEIVSRCRYLFFNKRGNVTLLIIGFVALMMTTSEYIHNRKMNTQRIRSEARAIAGTAAPEFSNYNLNEIKTFEDASSPLYNDVVGHLSDLRKRNPIIEYAYIMRRTDNPYYFEFIADADSIDLSSKEDLNEDGLVNDVIIPGQFWFEENPEDSAIHRGYFEPAADSYPTTDLWGTWIAGHAPIISTDGETVGIIGVDINANKIESLTKESFEPLHSFIVFILIFLAIKIIPMNCKSNRLLSEYISRAVRSRKNMVK